VLLNTVGDHSATFIISRIKSRPHKP